MDKACHEFNSASRPNRGRRPRTRGSNVYSNSTELTGSTSKSSRKSNVGKHDGSVKHWQRHKTSQLIEGMSNLAVLDVGLSDPLDDAHQNPEPSNSNHKNPRIDNRKLRSKLNLAHMINRPSCTDIVRPNIVRNNVNQRRRVSTKIKDPVVAHKYSKQQFLQANCQFVVLNGYDYSIHQIDPDWPVDWERIEEIKFNQCASSETTCPICLEIPVAAKITKCGHIFCWTCMLHYISLSDDKCRQCPICFEFVYDDDLRSVVSHSFIAVSIDSEIHMRLMIRKKNCVNVEPYSNCNQSANDLLLDTKSSEFDYWSQENLFIVDAQTVINNITSRERQELNSKLLKESDDPGACLLIERALQLLDKRESQLKDMRDIINSKCVKTSDQTNSQAANINNFDLTSSYLFYQSIDGQHIYLNPFSTKVLCHQFGTLENCPLEIKAKVLQMDWISMSDGWRKRFRYLSHLPLTCEFKLIEIDFDKSNLVSRSTYENFEDEIVFRKLVRDKQLREERKREKIIRVEQDRKIYGIQPSLRINLNNPDQFPSVSDERFIGLSLATTDHVPEDEAFNSSDDDESLNRNGSNPLDSATINSNLEVLSNPSCDELNNVTLSFAEIQLQEMASATNKTNIPSSTSVNAWLPRTNNCPSSSGGASGANSSSFAQLLVDAKSSNIKWSNKASSHVHRTTSNGNRIEGTPNSFRPRDILSTNQEDASHDEEELRAPGAHTISDFIDFNIVTGSSKRSRGRQRSGGYHKSRK